MTSGSGRSWLATLAAAVVSLCVAQAWGAGSTHPSRPVEQPSIAREKETGRNFPDSASAGPAANAGKTRAIGEANAAPTRQPNIEGEPIRRSVAKGAADNHEAPAAKSTGGLEFGKVAGALVLVIAVILGLKWMGRRVFAVPTASRSSVAIQVLSRVALSPRQQIMLLRVGRRLIVVADTGAQMNAISEIADDEEVAALVGQLQSDKTESASRAFGTLFGRVKRGYEPEPSATGAASSVDETREGDVDEMEAVASTRDELSGLMEKVRLVSRQFKGS